MIAQGCHYEILKPLGQTILATLTSDERTEHAQRIGGMILQSHPEIQDALKPKAKKPGGGTPGFFYLSKHSEYLP